MAELRLHGSRIETVFDLLGHRENDMTYALGWGLARCDALLRRLLTRIAPEVPFERPVAVDLQEHDALDRGFTDIEILTANLHAIIEAKRGWSPPSPAQLRRYEARLAASSRAERRIVILTQSGAEQVVRHQLAGWTPPPHVEARVLAWADVADIARRASHEGRLAERRLAADLASYLRGVADMRNTESNSVFVVSLSSRPFNAKWPAGLRPLDIVEKYGRYFFPATGENWPKTPPNYIAFRYWGALQSIHHVDDYTIAQDMSPFIPGAPDTSDWAPHFLLNLGPAMRPPRPMKAGPKIVRAMRVWVDLDLLLTAATISEAHQQTRARRNG